jgi:hypothetical protein
MYIDWMTWSIWSLGLVLLLSWCFETYREFRLLFARHRGGNLGISAHAAGDAGDTTHPAEAGERAGKEA